jgi:hypothetical protein
MLPQRLFADANSGLLANDPAGFHIQEKWASLARE